MEVRTGLAEASAQSGTRAASASAAPALASAGATRGRSRKRAAAVSVEIVRAPEKLSALGPAWDRLAGSSSQPMQQVAWAQACAAALIGRERALHVVVAGGPDLTAVAPLGKRAGVFDRLELLEMSALGEVTDFVYASPA